MAPFRIMGNLYYVGASDITSFLIVTPKGNILLDGGFLETARQIEANVKTLGFRLEDTKILLNSQAHYDHTGGLAELKKLSGAQMVASEGDTPMLETGGRGDPYFGEKYIFQPVHVDRRLRNGDTVRLGGTCDDRRNHSRPHSGMHHLDDDREKRPGSPFTSSLCAAPPCCRISG